MLKRILIAALFAARAYAACASGFIQITDPFLLPNAAPWSGSIVYTLAYPTTVAGSSVPAAQQQFNVTSGISRCLAPGLYTPVQLFQGGTSFAVTQAWGVPVSGGPYTIAQISSNVTLMGSFGSVVLSGTPSAGQVPTATSPTAATWQTPASGAILSTRVTLQQSDILNLSTIPVTLIGAPGAGKYLAILLCVTSQNDNPTYTSDGAAAFLIGNNVVGDQNIFFNSGDASFYFQFAPVVVTGDGSTLVNQPYTLSATGAVTGTGGTMTVITYYQVVTIP